MLVKGATGKNLITIANEFAKEPVSIDIDILSYTFLYHM